MVKIVKPEFFGLNQKKIENESSDKIFVDGKSTLVFSNRKTRFCRIEFRGQVENAGGYLVINEQFPVSINSVTIMPIDTPAGFSLKLAVAAESALIFENLTFEELEDREYLTENREVREVLVITPTYPSYINLYYSAFAHARNLEYKKKGIEFQVAAISSDNWYESLYTIDGIEVLQGGYRLLEELLNTRGHKCIVVHFADEKMFAVLDKYLDDSDQILLICHGPETIYRYLLNVTRPYYAEPLPREEFEKLFDLKDQYVRRYSQKDNVEWIFVSEWLKDYSEDQQKLKFKHSRVISNIINEELFPYVQKSAEQRKRILLIRKFDNIRQHAIDQAVSAILELEKRDFFDDLTFDIYGDGNYYETLVAPVREMSNVHLHRTFIPNNKLAELYRNEGILLIPSRHDTQGVAMGEAASSGLVVVGSAVTCIPYFMQQERFHTLAEPEDPAGLADIIERLYRNPDEFLRISRELSEFTRENFGAAQTVNKEIKLIEEKVAMIERNEKEMFKDASRKPVLTILIPMYNTEKYIKRCLDSLLVPEILNDIEVMVVNDGSKDHSVDIVKTYVEKYPQTVVLIDKENGGHGSTINAGLKAARGKYFRVLDSDDWFNTAEFIKFVKRLKDEDADLVVCDYRKEHTYNSKSEYFEYKNLKDRQLYKLDEIDLKILDGEYFVMATSTYKTEVMREAGLKMLENTFYVDMQYNVVPITKVETFVYYHLDIYRYFIGRKEQSMNMDNFVRNQEHHKKMIKWLIEYYTGISETLSANKREYIEIILTYTLNTHYSIYCEYDKNHERAYREIVDFDNYLLKTNKNLYERLNCMAYVRYNRKTGFKFVKVNGKKWYTAMRLARQLKGN